MNLFEIKQAVVFSFDVALKHLVKNMFWLSACVGSINASVRSFKCFTIFLFFTLSA